MKKVIKVAMLVSLLMVTTFTIKQERAEALITTPTAINQLFLDHEFQLYIAMATNNGTDVTALVSQAQLDAVKGIILYSKDVKSLEGVQHLRNLESVDIRFCDLADISPLANSSKLLDVTLEQTRVSDISVLADKTKLLSVYLMSEKVSITDISALAGLHDLLFLTISRNLGITDFSPIYNKPNLLILDLSYTGFNDLNSLTEFKELTVLSIGGNNLTNFDVVLSLPKLQKLGLSGNQITDYSKLTNTGLDLAIAKDQVLNVPECRVNSSMIEVRCDAIKITGPNNTTLAPLTIEGTNATFDAAAQQIVWSYDDTTTAKSYTYYDTNRATAVISKFWDYSATITQNFIHEYSITYDANTGTGVVPVDTKYYESTVPATLASGNTLSKPGNLFLGWSTNPNATVADYTVGQNVNLTADTTFYAVWESSNTRNFTITYHANNGTGALLIDTAKYNIGDIVTIIHDGKLFASTHPFLGWSTNPNATVGEHLPGNNVTINGDITLYAIWKTDTPVVPIDKLPITGSQDILTVTLMLAFAMFATRKFFK